MIQKTTALRSGKRHRQLLMMGASLATLTVGLAARPADAQTISGILGSRAARPAPTGPVTAPTTTPRRPANMTEALARQRSTQSRAEQIKAYALAARNAALAQTRAGVTDGLSANGLDPVTAIRDAVAANNAGDTAHANELLVSASATNDPTGLNTWEGAGLPGQTTEGGRTVVTINQTQSRALLSWNRFDVGENTTVQFNQKANGVAQPGWVAVNRVVNSVAPSLILGRVRADGTVVVLNQRGIIFGQNAQINTHSLLASTLELGNAAVRDGVGVRAASLSERNNAYLQNGLFLPQNNSTVDQTALLVSANLAEQSYPDPNFQPVFSSDIEGALLVDPGAQITTDSGGFLILVAPSVTNGGVLSATNGQVSLQAGRAVAYVQSTGAATSSDPNVRGFKLESYTYVPKTPQQPRPQLPDDGVIVQAGVIQSRRGYISLGTDLFGSVTHTGYLETTTSVSRNGKISIHAGTVVLGGDADMAKASGIAMLADTDGETIPQGTADDPSGFKTSQLEIGAYSGGELLPLDFSMGVNALIYAPSADIAIGRRAGAAANQTAALPSRIDIASGAVIDVSGLKDVQLDASRNSLEIDPVKRNELRDTPNYREVPLDGSFSLNGATLFVDPRLSGVRDDGVAWVGSPLIEAGSLASQIASTAPEFMTKGGTVSLGTNIVTGNTDAATAPYIHIARDARIDFSGGWVNYAAGVVRTSRLVTDDGRIVDIANADPNDVYVAVAEGFTTNQPRFGFSQTFGNATSQDGHFEASYDEGRDAGALILSAPAIVVDGSFYGNAFAGARQTGLGNRGTFTSLLTQDPRLLQRDASELPAGGFLRIGSFSGAAQANLGADILVYHGTRGSAEADRSEILLSDTMLTDAGLSALTLQTSGAVTFAGATPDSLQPAEVVTFTGASNLSLAPGGTLRVDSGRAIRFDGTVTAASGAINARTYEFTPVIAIGDSLGTIGSPFRTGQYGTGDGDDLAAVYTATDLPDSPFDITVTGTLSTAGLWVNDYYGGQIARGGAFSDGGSISLTVAPRVFVALGTSFNTATRAGDLSGSIHIESGAALNVASGGYVDSAGGLHLNARGGNITLRNETIYASPSTTIRGGNADDVGDSSLPFGGTNQSVDFTPNPAGQDLRAGVPALVPDARSTVEIAAGTISAFGFDGGGTFTLVAPDISFGSDDHAGSTHIGLDFFATTGFATLDVTSYRSRIVDDLFTNARAGNSAFFDTTRFVIGDGETLDLTQTVLPSILTTEQSRALLGLASDSDITAQALFQPIVPAAGFDRRAANLRLGGLTELDVLAGGTIIGAPQATITASKLYNAGRIYLPGGTITQQTSLFAALVNAGLGVRDATLGGEGLADAFGGTVDAQGRFNENAFNAAGVLDPVTRRRLTNHDLVSRQGADRLIYFLGVLDQSQGIVLDTGSVTDLSGVTLLDPRTAFRPDGTRIRQGRVIAGGTLQTASAQDLGLSGGTLFTDPTYGSVRYTDISTLPTGPYRVSTPGRTLEAREGAAIDISGTSTLLDQRLAGGLFKPVLQWSNAGRIALLSGGTIDGATIDANGGAAGAQGGTLEWLRPTVGVRDAVTGLDFVQAAQIEASGFDTFIARNTLRLEGDFSLSLGKAFIVASQAPLGASPIGDDARISVSAARDTHATIAAPYIRFASRVPTVNNASAATPGDTTVRFVAGSGIDMVGGVLFDRSIPTLTLETPGDLRLIGVDATFSTDPTAQHSLNGRLIAGGDLNIDAGRTYATTGTGNLQRELQGLTDGGASPYVLAALGDSIIHFGNSHINTTAPLSAGTHLQIFASEIEQDGYLAAPLGLLELGSNAVVTEAGVRINATTSLTFGEGSVTTVAGTGLNVPYGTTTDLIDYFFSPTVTVRLSAPPTGQLELAGTEIDVQEGARIDGRGGGDIFAYEFQSGVGGSRDVLDRFNTDRFSSNDYDPATGIGYQYADHRQVFALVPIAQAGNLAAYDPIYAADYGSAGPVDLYGAQAGLAVTLDASPGVAAGTYLLLPAHYALAIPGALRVVENTGISAPIPGATETLLDGSVIVGGTYSYLGTDFSDSQRRSFTLQTKDTFSKYSKLVTTSGSDTLAAQATRSGSTLPRLPLDAARVILSPLAQLRVAGVFDTTPAKDGLGAQIDINAANIIIARDGAADTVGAVTVTEGTIAGLNANSLLVGGVRTDNADGTTTLGVRTRSILVNDGVELALPEMIFAVSGIGSQLRIGDDVKLTATGTLADQRSGDYVISTDLGSPFDNTGVGSLVRLASGPERLIARPGTAAERNTLGATTLTIGDATLTGNALAIDSTRNFNIADDTVLNAPLIAISGDMIQFQDDATGLSIGSNLEARLAAATRLTIRTPDAVRFSAGTHSFHGLVIDAPSLTLAAGSAADASLVIDAGDVRLTNSAKRTDSCATANACGLGTSLTLNTTTLSFGANGVRAFGFSDSVLFSASNGMYVEDTGTFSVGNAALTLDTPFLADRSTVADPRAQHARPDYSFLTTGAFTMRAPGAGAPAVLPTGNAAPGARIGIGTSDARVASVTIDRSLIRATSGLIDIQSTGDISLTGATLATPGYTATFGDADDSVTVSAGAGTVNLLSLNGDLNLGQGSSLVTDTGVGAAGTLNLLAGNGAIVFDATLNPGTTGARSGSLNYDSGESAFDLAGFVTRYGNLFGGDIAIHSGAGNLDLAAGQTIRATSVSLTADGGAIGVAGRIDTSGVNVAGMTADAARNARVNGGDIALWGAGGVHLGATAVLDTHTTGYAATDTRPASAGNVTLGIERADAAITIDQGATIDVGARRTQAAIATGDSGGRLVTQTIKDQVTLTDITAYRYVEPDTGGTVLLRAPVIGANGDKVAISAHGTISGAASIEVEGFRRYDLDALAQNGSYGGIATSNGNITLNFGQDSTTGFGRNPFTEDFTLAGGAPSIVHFIRNFDISTADGSSLAGMRLRPGIDLVAAHDVTTLSAWNLAAATFSDAQINAAVAAGDLVVNQELSDPAINPYYTGPVYSVAAGHEGALLERANFLYRVDGSARGEAPIITLRAGGNLSVERSITDGFFTFRDKSDAGYINYQLGGGSRDYSPAIQFNCGRASLGCTPVVSYEDGSATTPNPNSTITIGLGSPATRGAQTSPAYINSPFPFLGNGAAGLGTNHNAAGQQSGDPLGFAELFPLLPDNTAIHSSDLRLVAGTNGKISANPLHVDRAATADVKVEGEYSYRVESVRGRAIYDGPLQFSFRSGITFDRDATLDDSDPTLGLTDLTGDEYTVITWGTGLIGLPEDARTAAERYFSGRTFTGLPGETTGVIAPLSEVLGFLDAFDPTYQAGIRNGSPGYVTTAAGGPANVNFTARDAFVRTYVRTGDGAIDVAAARDINLLGMPTAEYRMNTGVLGARDSATTPQFAGAAIYSSGVRVAASTITAQTETGTRMTIMPDSPYLGAIPERVDFIPSTEALSDTPAALAHGGGDVSLDAGRDVLGRRTGWDERFFGSGVFSLALSGSTTDGGNTVGSYSQRWRAGTVGVDTEIGISPRYFSSGVGALGGGDVTIHAGRDVSDLTVALDSSITTTQDDANPTLMTFGNGNLEVLAGRNIAAGQYDVATGSGSVIAGADVTSLGTEPVFYTNLILGAQPDQTQYLRVRLTDAVVKVSARGAATVGSVSALGAATGNQLKLPNPAGFFTATASFSLTATEQASIVENRTIEKVGVVRSNANDLIQILPPTLEMTSLTDSIVLPRNGSARLLYPSQIGQLRLFSRRDIDSLVIAMSDADPTLLGGAFVAPISLTPYNIPTVTPTTGDAELRLQHNEHTTHLGDSEPVRIYSNGSIVNSAIFVPKQARITAGTDIVDLLFSGQNVAPTDVTRIRAGRDITATSGIGSARNLPYLRSNAFTLGGPGSLLIEAGRDLGPFINSATIDGVSYAGGIRSIGNDANPWLAPQGADISATFGIAAGADYAGLREIYLNPANLAELDGDLFVQVTDSAGNSSPDRSRPIYAPILAEWLRDKQPAAFAQLFGGQSFPDTDSGNAALASAAYGRFADLYAALAGLDILSQRDFLINRLYFNELAEPARPDSPSYLQYYRGYLAVQTLFPTGLGYTDNLALYTIDPSTVSADHPQGVPTRLLVDGQPKVADRVVTGNVDLRLATIETTRGGDISILGPGGDFIAGSIVRTSVQAERRESHFGQSDSTFSVPDEFLSGQIQSVRSSVIDSIPIGFEGVLTLRGGQIRSFTDGDFRLNQSRLFALAGGDITMWSSNGDLNAGQGPKSASTFPPITVRFDPNGLSEVNSAGSVAGAGIGAFKPTADSPASNVILIAPVGEVDAGDAGVRASGNVFVAAARVANADNFSAGGDISGVPSASLTAAPAVPADAGSATAAQAAQAANANQNNGDRRSLITVDVLGPAAGAKDCEDPKNANDPDCREPGGPGGGMASEIHRDGGTALPSPLGNAELARADDRMALRGRRAVAAE